MDLPRYGAATGYWGSNKVGDVNYYWDEPPFSPQQIQHNFETSSTEPDVRITSYNVCYTKLLRHFYEIGEWEFFDLKKDPSEMKNDYNNSHYQSEIVQLKEELVRLRKTYQIP